MEGYKCDLCGDFRQGEPTYTVRPQEQASIMQGGKFVRFVFPQYDVCDDCTDLLISAIGTLRRVS
jgi:hypothetical protein